VTALLTTNLGSIPLLGRGKVRDLYAVDDALLMVATDRISAFDHVLATGIPGKGKILTQISLFWFDLLANLVPNHLIETDAANFPAVLQPYRDQLEGRSMLVTRAAMFPSPAACSTDRAFPNRYLHPPPRARTARTTRTSPLPPPRRCWAPPMRQN